MLRLPLVRLSLPCALLCLLALPAPAATLRAQQSPPLPEPAPTADAHAAAPQAAPAQPAAAQGAAAQAEADAALAAAAAARELGGKVLERAAQFQRGDVPQPTPTSLHGRFSVGVRDKEGSLVRADAERWFTVNPERMYTHRTEALTGSAAGLGWNGSMAWFRDDADKRIVRYTDAPETFSEDLDLMQEQLRLTRLLLTASVMDALRPRLTDVTASGTRDVIDLDGARHETALVTARVADELYPAPAGGPPPLPGTPPRQLELHFAIDRETGALWELRVSAVGRPEIAPLRLRFDFHGPTASGLRVPGNIRMYREGDAQESLNLGVEEQAGLLLFDVNAPIEPSIFEPPAS